MHLEDEDVHQTAGLRVPMKKRRANSEGSIFQRRDGRWCAYLTLAGKRRYHYAHTQRECVAWLAEMRKQTDEGLSADANRITTADYLARWIDVARRSLAPNTGDQYAGTIRKHIAPVLGKVPLGKLRPDHLQVLYTSLQDRGTGIETIHVVHSVLSKSMRQAVKWGILSRSPAVGLDLPRHQRLRAITPLTIEQVRVLLAAAHGHPLEAMVALAVNTGMRHGELLGLQWPDVDWRTGLLHVRRQFTSYGYIPLKSRKSERAIPLGADTLAVLRRHWERRQFTQPEALPVFCDAKGQPWSRKFTLPQFYALLEAAGLPRVRFHDLRHTAATLMLEAGVHPKVVQERLGHASIAITLDTYSHVAPSMQQAAAETLDARIAGRVP